MQHVWEMLVFCVPAMCVGWFISAQLPSWQLYAVCNQFTCLTCDGAAAARAPRRFISNLDFNVTDDDIKVRRRPPAALP